MNFTKLLRTPFLRNISGRLLLYEVTLVKKHNKPPLLQKSETKIFDRKTFHKKLVPSQRKNKLGGLDIRSDV